MAWSISSAMMAAYESLHYSRAQGAASSAVICSDGALSAQSNTTPMPDQYYWPDKTTEHSRLSRFGMTCELLTENHGAELLTWFLAGFPARTYQQPEKARDSTASEAASGVKWQGSFARYSHDSSSWKTAQCSLLADSDEYSETWPRWGSMRNGASYLRPIPALPTFESASGLSLNWPTPTVCGNYNRPGASATSGMGLASAVRLWPTPTGGGKSKASCLGDWGGSGARKTMKTLIEPEEMYGPLNPEWVEWLMGWPIGQTDLKPLETAKFQEFVRSHSIFYQGGSSERS